MNAAKTTETSPIVTISGPGAIAPGLTASKILKRNSAYSATLSRSPESTAEIGVGPSACASGSQACSGASPTLVPYPSRRKMKAASRSAGSKRATRSISSVHTMASTPPPITGCAERQVHGEHQHLVHRVVEAQVLRRQPAGLQFMGDVSGAEHAGRKTDER